MCNGTEFAVEKAKTCYMKKIFCILFAMLQGVGMAGASDDNSRVIDVCAGSGYNTVYTIRGNEVCEGSGYNVVYTIRGNEVCEGSGYRTVYTMR